MAPLLAESDEGADLFNLDTEDLVTEIMDGHQHLLDQQDDIEQLALYTPAAPSGPAPVIHAGPPAAKPATHTLMAPQGQKVDFSPPPPSTRSPKSPHVKSSFAHRPTGHHKPPRQEPTYHQHVKQATGVGWNLHQRYQPNRSNALHDHELSRQDSEQSAQTRPGQLSHKLSDLTLGGRLPAVGGDRARRHKSSFVEAYPTSRHVEQVERRSHHHLPSRHAGSADVPPRSRKACQPEYDVVADRKCHVDQASSREWEDEDDEHEYEEVTVSRAKTAPNGNEPNISTRQDLKHTSLVWAESSAKMMYLCGRGMYEVMWTSQTSQRLRKSAMHTTQKASGQAADSLGRLVKGTGRGQLGGVKQYVSHKCFALKAASRSPRAARSSAVRALRLSRMKLAEIAVPILGLRDEEPESDIEANWDLCDDIENDQHSKSHVTSDADDYGDEGLDVPGLYEDILYEDQ